MGEDRDFQRKAEYLCSSAILSWRLPSANYFIHVRGTTCLLYTSLYTLPRFILSFINVALYSVSLHRPICDGRRIANPIYPFNQICHSGRGPHLTIITLPRRRFLLYASFSRFALSDASGSCAIDSRRCIKRSLGGRRGRGTKRKRREREMSLNTL